MAPTTMIEVPRRIVLRRPSGLPTKIHASAPVRCKLPAVGKVFVYIPVKHPRL